MVSRFDHSFIAKAPTPPRDPRAGARARAHASAGARPAAHGGDGAKPAAAPSESSRSVGTVADIALLLALVALTVAPAAGFKFMVNWKVPTLDRMISQKQAAEKFGDKKLVVITGTSSGLGRKTAKALLRTGQYHVVGAVRDLDKMEVVAEEDEFDLENFTPMQVELNNFTSVNDFVERLMEFKAAKHVDRLILNAG
ncbi:hypothetical protein T484DRAFT_1783813, partial [Baffinella frigidus]